MKKLEDYVINIPDFPKPGIIFRDITSILRDPEGLKLSVHELMHCLEGTEFDVVVGAESRGSYLVCLLHIIRVRVCTCT